MYLCLCMSLFMPLQMTTLIEPHSAVLTLVRFVSRVNSFVSLQCAHLSKSLKVNYMCAAISKILHGPRSL